MTIAEATPDLEQVDRNDRAFLGHPKGLGYLGFTEACERFSYYSMQTLLVLYMVNYLLVPARMALSWLGRPAARVGNLRRLQLTRLPDADPRRAHRRQAHRPEGRDDRRRPDHVARPFPDGHRGRLSVRLALADRWRRPVQGQYRDAGRRLVRGGGPPPRDGVPDILHLHQ